MADDAYAIQSGDLNTAIGCRHLADDLQSLFEHADQCVEVSCVLIAGAMMPRAALDVVRAAADDLLQARSGGKLSFGDYVIGPGAVVAILCGVGASAGKD